MNDLNNNISNFIYSLNDKLLIIILILNGLIIISSLFITYLLIDSIISTFFGLTIAVTIGVMANYFIITRYKLIKNISIDLIQENIDDEVEEFQNIMK